MAKGDNKARILYVYRLLLQETDKEHDITVRQIIERLEGMVYLLIEKRSSLISSS